MSFFQKQWQYCREATLLVAWLLFLGSVPGGTYVLKYKMRAGEIRYYSTTTDAVLVQELQGLAHASKTQATARVKLVAEESSNADQLSFVLSNESLVIKVSAPGLDSTFIDPAGLTGRRVRKTVAGNGDQITSQELDFYEVLDAVPGFGSEQEFLTNVPAIPMSFGETVNVTDIDSIRTFGGIAVSSTNVAYSILGVEEKQGLQCLKLSFKGSVRLRGEGARPGVDFFLEGDGTVVGTLYFAPEQGLLVQSENKTELGMTATIAGTENVTIPIFQTARFTLSLLE